MPMAFKKYNLRGVKMKRFISLVLATMLTISLLAGCSKPTDLDKDPSSNAPLTPETPVTITWMWNEGNVQLPDDSYIPKKVLADLNINYVHVSPKGTDYAERLMLLISGGTTPDIIMSYPELTPQLVAEDLVIPVNEYLNDQYIPNVIRISNNWDSAVKQLTYSDGNVYAIPGTSTNIIGEVPYIRMDWLKNLGKEVPTNYEELLDVLVAFAKEDPDGNGKADTYGTLSNEFWGMDPISRAFAVGFYWYKGEDGKPELGMLSPRVKDYLKLVKSMIDEGALNKDLMTTKFDQVQEKVKAGKVGFLFNWTGYEDEQEMINIDANALWKPIAPPKGAYDKGYLPVGNIIRDEYLISKSCKNVDAALKLMNYFADDKSTEGNITGEGSYWEMALGEKGVNWDIVDGIIETGNGASGNSELAQKFKDRNAIDTWHGKATRFRSKFDTRWMGASEETSANIKFLVDLPTEPYSIPDTDPLKPIQILGVVGDVKVGAFFDEWCYTKYGEQLFYNAVLGKGDIDALFEAFLANANASGYQEVRQSIADHIAKQ